MLHVVSCGSVHLKKVLDSPGFTNLPLTVQGTKLKAVFNTPVTRLC